jgi:hypothetical protein
VDRQLAARCAIRSDLAVECDRACRRGPCGGARPARPHGQWRWPARRIPVVVAVDEEWRPEAAPLRAWLEEADLLAQQGRFADAIHCLLLRAIDDLARRRPQLARPSLTGRELSQSSLLPARARTLFASIAEIVERSVFGNRLVDEVQWNEARRSYSQFALAGSWQK